MKEPLFPSSLNLQSLHPFLYIYNNAPEMQILFGQSETPTRIFVGIQSTDAFTGLFNKSVFAFDHRLAKAANQQVVSSFEAPVTYQKPQISPMIPPMMPDIQEAEIPLEANEADPEPQRAGLASTAANAFRKIYCRFTGSETQSRIPNVQERVMPPTAFLLGAASQEVLSQRTFQRSPQLLPSPPNFDVGALAADDIFIRKMDLKKDGIVSKIYFFITSYMLHSYFSYLGTSLQSLSTLPAELATSPNSYFQFCKTLGAVSTGFSPGITLEVSRNLILFDF